jgi:hypothetical protein
MITGRTPAFGRMKLPPAAACAAETLPFGREIDLETARQRLSLVLVPNGLFV